MDKKAKKRIDTINKKLQTLRQQLAGARKQPDEPAETNKLETEIAALQEELERLKKS